ncbi:MAG TPA: LLM class flavin-dependent oxidoreductase [Dehalococcoidia bacterium]|nr:LLM class flavin-dependent oxidoreductase [Dehalococcoidia bacterium]
MKFSLLYELEMPKPWHEGGESELFFNSIEQIRLAEEMGFEYVWTVEHHCLEEFAHSSAPEVFYGALSQVTEKIRLGHGAVLIVPGYNHPIRVAERISTLDILSKGRVELGMARSTTLTEMEAFGIDPATTREGFDEAIRIIPRLMMEDRFPGYKGKYFTVGENRNVVPKPVQKPHPPLWMACSQPDSFELAGNYGVGVLCFTVQRPEALTERIQAYRRTVQNPAHAVSPMINNQVAGFTMVHCDEDRNAAFEEGGMAALWYRALRPKSDRPYFWDAFETERRKRFEQIDSYKWTAGRFTEELGLYLGADQGGEVDPRLLDPVKMATSGMVCMGNPDDCIAAAERFEAQGLDQLMCLVQAGRIPHEKVMNTLRLFGKYVIPHFQEKEKRRAAEAARA